MRAHPWIIAWGTWLVLMAAGSLAEYCLSKRPASGGAAGQVRKRTQRPDSSDPHPRAPAAGAAGTSCFRISAIIDAPSGNTAIIDGQAVRRGQTVNGAKVLSVGPREVALEKDGRRFTVKM